MIRRFIGPARLRVRLAFIVAMALAPVGVLAFAQALKGLEASAEQTEAQLQALAQIAVDEERQTVAAVRRAAALAAVEMRAEPTLLLRCEEYFGRIAGERDWLTVGVLLDAGGRVVCGANRSLGVAEDPGWRRFVERPGFVLAGARTGRVSGRSVLAAYFPVADARGAVVALAFGVDLRAIRRVAEPTPGLPSFALLDSDGAVVFARDADRGPGPAEWLPADRQRLLVYGDRALAGVGEDGVARSYFASALETGQLWAVTARARPTLRDLAVSPEGIALLVPFALWLVAVGVAYFAIDVLFSRHIDRLRAVAFRIGRGELDAPVGDFLNAPHELRALGHSIRAMATRIAEREHRLQETLEVQRRLLLEVHHRVKNNLQMISSLMNIETRRARDPDTLATMRLIQDRIHALALVHQNLYEAENVERIALARLVGDVCRHLETSLGPRNAGGRIVTSLEEIVVDTMVATPVVLFLSEAVSNAYKHADPEAPGIRVELTRMEDGFMLAVANRAGAARDGGGGSGGLGMKLMAGFAKQLGGRLMVEPIDGVHRVALSAPNAARPGLFAIRRPRGE